jgi:hypothetical protein
MKRLIINFLLINVFLVGWGQTKKETVWNEVVAGYANTPVVKVTKVTYKLIDRDGTILDVNADPRNLEGLAKLLEQMKPANP